MYILNRTLTLCVFLLLTLVSYSQESGEFNHSIGLHIDVVVPEVPSKYGINTHLFYDVNVGYGYGLEYHLDYQRNPWLNAKLTAGIASRNFEGRNFTGVLMDDPVDPVSYRIERWVNMNQYYFRLGMGPFIQPVESLDVGFLFYGDIHLGAREMSREVWLTDTFGADQYFEKERTKVLDYRTMTLSYGFFIRHYLNDKWSLSLIYSDHIQSINKRTTDFNNTTAIELYQFKFSLFYNITI